MAKKLLSEAVVRRFAKLANLSPINEMNSLYNEDEEGFPPDEEVAIDAEEGFPPEEEIVDVPPEGEEIEMDADAPADLEFGEEEVAKIRDVLPILQDIADAGTGGGEGEFEEPIEPGLEDEEFEEPIEPGLEDEEFEGEPEEDEFLGEALRGINYLPGKQEVVQEVARRVAKRLLAAKRADSQLKEALGVNRRRASRTARTKK